MNKIHIKQIGILTIGMLVTKVSAFIENIILAYLYGTSEVSDAFILSLTIPNVFYTAISASIGLCIVQIINRKGLSKQKANEYISILLEVMLISSMIVAFLVSVFSKEICYILSPKSSSAVLESASHMVSIISLSSFFVFAVGVLQGYLQSVQDFTMIAFIQLPLNIGVTISLIISNKFGTNALSFGILISYFLQAVFIYLSAKKNGYRIKIERISSDNGHLKETMFLIGPLIMGTVINDINIVVDKAFAGGFGTGIITGFDYGSKVTSLFFSILLNPLMTVLYPEIAKLSGHNDYETITEKIKKALITYTVLLGFFVCFLIVLNRPLCQLLFSRGKFDAKSLEITRISVLLYATSLVPMAYRFVLEKCLVADGKAVKSTINAIFTVASNVFFDFFLSAIWGYKGLPIATTVSFVVSSIYLAIELSRNKVKIFDRRFVFKNISMLCVIIATSFIGMEICSKLNRNNSDILGIMCFLLINGVILAIVYTVLMLIFKVISYSEFKNKLNIIVKRQYK